MNNNTSALSETLSRFSREGGTNTDDILSAIEKDRHEPEPQDFKAEIESYWTYTKERERSIR